MNNDLKYCLELEKEKRERKKTIDRAKIMLETIGYVIKEKDNTLLDVYLEKIDNYILNITHLEKVPLKLNLIRLFRLVGELLYLKVMTNEIDIETLQLEPMITELTIGDTKTTFEKPNVSNREIFLKFIDSTFKNYGYEEIIQYRVLVW